MGEQKPEKAKKHICLGILAHVDAGKTTLSESMLYVSGSIRKMGRVDHQDAFLDTYDLERARGITIFSKQAVFSWKELGITLLDTPGHVDFSAEMERTLQVLDYAVLVISGADGVQGHTETLWRLLGQYRIPVFLFVNKMDQEGIDRDRILAELKKRFGDHCIDFERAWNFGDDEAKEELAMCEDGLLEQYLETGELSRERVAELIAERKVFPCYFGSALRTKGVEELLNALLEFTQRKEYPEEFGAKVYKIGRDEQGNRLTYLKVTGGRIRVRESITDSEEKIHQIRRYSGSKYEMLQQAGAGEVCAVTGLSGTYPGQGLGAESASDMPILEPVLNYRIELPPDCDVHKMLLNLKELEEEEPELHIVWEEQLEEIHAQLMGEVQIEILKSLIWDRFKVRVEFGTGRVVYKESIEEPVEGVGHFEPLRHYAEVHLLLEPGERGSGLQFFSDCNEDVLARNWQRLILTHLEEKEHRGVLTGSAITDMKITLVSGRAHQKHTEGGDFRQATYRAVRQGLRKAKSVLLEPYYEFEMELLPEHVGRAMTDIQKRNGTFEPPVTDGEISVLKGSAPVSKMRGYQTELTAYTGGRGRMSCRLKGYEKCAEQEEIVAAMGYDPEADLENPTGSVFCAHGAGFVVNWDEVESYMHLESSLESEPVAAEEQSRPVVRQTRSTSSQIELTREELDAIYAKTPDPVKKNRSPVTVRAKSAPAADDKWIGKQKTAEEYLLVDGYNIIFAWEELKELAKIDLKSARDKLMDVLCNYQGYKKCVLILVFDAYKVEGGAGAVMKYHNIHVVYTKEAETADQYIEKTVRRIGKHHHITVATSDALEQVIILGQGAARMSAPGLKEEVELALAELRREHLDKTENDRNYLFDYLKTEDARKLESVRLGRPSGKMGEKTE